MRFSESSVKIVGQVDTSLTLNTMQCIEVGTNILKICSCSWALITLL